MKLHVSLLALLLAGAYPAAAQEPPPGDGPRGSSQSAAGEARYDAVGYAAIGALAGVSGASAVLPPGSHAEVTALDSGRTIVVAILGGTVAPDRVVTLSNGAATALGLTGDGSAVRVRRVTPTPQDIVQLRDGQAASFRAEAPPALLVALRKKLPPTPAATAAPAPKPMASPTPVKTAAATAATPIPAATPVPTPKTEPAPKPGPTPKSEPAGKPVPTARPATSGYVVQVAALSTAARAAVVAKAVGGTVLAGPPVWRVRLGPYPDAAAAALARAEAASKGYPGGQITRRP